MSIPMNKVTIKAINRFPELYKRQTLQFLYYEKRDGIRTTANTFIMASVLALIEEFDFGTTENATRIPRFIAKLQEIVDVNAEYYDDAVAEGLKNKLHGLGIEYNLGKDDGA